jgi:hypothetical protein
MVVVYTCLSDAFPPLINASFYRSCDPVIRKEVSSYRTASLTKLYIPLTDFLRQSSLQSRGKQMKARGLVGSAAVLPKKAK